MLFRSDIRHKPSAQDVQMYEYLKYYGLDGIVVATKADKVGSNQIKLSGGHFDRFTILWLFVYVAFCHNNLVSLRLHPKAVFL